jgi:hypothetical protein
VWLNDTSAIPIVSAITLPTGRQYQFSYDTTYGLLNKITYPNGGYISYSWAPNTQSEFAALVDANGTSEGCPYRYDSVALSHRYVSFDRIRSYANCRVSPALSSQNLILDPVSSTLVPRIPRPGLGVRGFFSPQFTFNFELSTIELCANSFRINTYETTSQLLILNDLQRC